LAGPASAATVPLVRIGQSPGARFLFAIRSSATPNSCRLARSRTHASTPTTSQRSSSGTHGGDGRLVWTSLVGVPGGLAVHMGVERGHHCPLDVRRAMRRGWRRGRCWARGAMSRTTLQATASTRHSTVGPRDPLRTRDPRRSPRSRIQIRAGIHTGDCERVDLMLARAVGAWWAGSDARPDIQPAATPVRAPVRSAHLSAWSS